MTFGFYLIFFEFLLFLYTNKLNVIGKGLTPYRIVCEPLPIQI